MKAKYTPPKGIKQLTYNVSKKEIDRLLEVHKQGLYSRMDWLETIVKIHCGKQSDANYEKWITNNRVIVNFNHNGIHVYMRLLHITRIHAIYFGIGYKLLVCTIKELPK